MAARNQASQLMSKFNKEAGVYPLMGILGFGALWFGYNSIKGAKTLDFTHAEKKNTYEVSDDPVNTTGRIQENPLKKLKEQKEQSDHKDDQIKSSPK